MRISCLALLGWILVSWSACLGSDLPVVRVEKIREEGAGGSFTNCAIGVVDGKKTFLKSIRGNPRGTRYANFESDILARAIFDRIDVRCPRASMVRLEKGSPLRAELGSPVLAMEFVSPRLAGGRLYNGFWPGPEMADTDEFMRLLVVDLLMGNADRRSANFFVTSRYGRPEGQEEPGSFRPVPIDNNCGFGTIVTWLFPTDQMNFLPTFDGVADGEILRDMGTIRNIVQASPCHSLILATPRLRPRLKQVATDVCTRLGDEVIARMVDALPREIIPRGIEVDPKPAWLDKIPAAAVRIILPMKEKLSGAALFAYRKMELRTTLAWRRDHLLEALEKHLAWRDSDPTQRQEDAEAMETLRLQLEKRKEKGPPRKKTGDLM